MQLMRFVGTLASLPILGLVGFVLGCSGAPDAPPQGKATVKTTAEARKSERQEEAKERASAKEGMRERKGRGPG